MTKRVLILGGRGYLASGLIQPLVDRGHEVRILAPETDGFLDELQRSAPIEVAQDLESAVDSVDYIFHLASREHFAGSAFAPLQDLETNAKLTLRLLEAVRLRNPKARIIFTSSAQIAGFPDSLPVDERSTDKPLTLFAFHKILSESYLRYYAFEFGIASVTLRLTNIYGPTPNPKKVSHVALNKMILNSLTTGRILLFANRNLPRDFLYFDDCINALLGAMDLAEAGQAKVYFLGSGESTSFKDIADIIQSELQTEQAITVQVDERPLARVENRESVIDASAFRKDSGWFPTTSLVEGLRKSISFLKEVAT